MITPSSLFVLQVVRSSMFICTAFVDQKHTGSFWFHWETWGYSVLLFTTEGTTYQLPVILLTHTRIVVVLLLWIFVVYQKDYRVLAFMGMLLVGEMTTVIVILSKSFSSLDGS